MIVLKIIYKNIYKKIFQFCSQRKKKTNFIIMKQLKTKTIVEKIKLIEGAFSPSQANDMVKDLIDTKINHHKLSRLSITEGNHYDDTTNDNEKIDELVIEKERLKGIIKEAQKSGKNLKISSLIKIEY